MVNLKKENKTMIDEKKIEEAAKEYAFKKDIFLQCGCHIGFLEGIDWFKKNIWHDAKEQPLQDELLIMQYIKDRRVKYIMYCWSSSKNCSWAEEMIDFHPTKWCYLKDLI